MTRREFIKAVGAAAVAALMPHGTNWGQSLVDTCVALGQAVGTAAALGKVEQIELSPLALTQLRITLFPWTTGTQKDDKL